MTHYIVLLRSMPAQLLLMCSSWRRQREGKSKLTFSPLPLRGTFKFPIAVTKLSFPNLWNYIRLWYFAAASTHACSAALCWRRERAHRTSSEVCFIVSDLVLWYRVSSAPVCARQGILCLRRQSGVGKWILYEQRRRVTMSWQLSHKEFLDLI